MQLVSATAQCTNSLKEHATPAGYAVARAQAYSDAWIHNSHGLAKTKFVLGCPGSFAGLLQIMCTAMAFVYTRPACLLLALVCLPAMFTHHKSVQRRSGLRPCIPGTNGRSWNIGDFVTQDPTLLLNHLQVKPGAGNIIMFG